MARELERDAYVAPTSLSRPRIHGCISIDVSPADYDGEPANLLNAGHNLLPLGVVVVHPAGEDQARLADREGQRLVEKLVAHATIEALDEPVLRRLARRDVMPTSPDQASTAFEVSSVPLSLTIILGLPRSAIRLVSSRTTRRPEIDVSTTAR